MGSGAGDRQLGREWGGGVAARDRQVLEQPAIDLQFGDRADAEAEPERWHTPEIAYQSGYRVMSVVREIDAGLHQDAAGADGLGIFGNERALLRECRRREVKRNDRRQAES